MKRISNHILDKKIQRIINGLKSRKSAVVALSGGVDSSVLAFLAKKALIDSTIAVTVRSAITHEQELIDAERIAKKIGIKHIVMRMDPLSNSNFVANPTNRCYYCKRELIGILTQVAKENDLNSVVDGTNADDLKSHRPGLLALKEARVYTPFVEGEINKEEIRALAEKFGLSISNKPSDSCLASRIPYGQEITKQRLYRIAEAERFIHSLIFVRQLRVRDHNNFARIEIERQDIKKFFDGKIANLIVQKLKHLGFSYITVDLGGYRSGSMDELLGD